MDDSANEVLDELVIILNRIRDNKIYGSVEIFFENGEVTQITQRIINKVKKPLIVKNKAVKNIISRHTQNEDLTHRVVTNLE